MPIPPSANDWPDASRYRYITELDRAGIAWEFVRRDPAYRAAVLHVGKVSERTERGVRILSDGYPMAAPWGLSFR